MQKSGVDLDEYEIVADLSECSVIVIGPATEPDRICKMNANGGRISHNPKGRLIIVVIIFAALIFSFLGMFVGKTKAVPTKESLPRTGITPRFSSSSIAITPDGSFLVVVNPDSNSISLVDAITLTLIREMPVGVDPRSVTTSLDGARAYVTNQGSDSLSVVDLIAQDIIAEIPIGDRPVGVAFSPNGEFLAISEFGADQVRMLDPMDFSTLSVISVADRPHGLAFTPDGKYLLVTHLLSGDVTILTVQPSTVYLPVVIDRSEGAFLFSGREPTKPKEDDFTPKKVISTWPNVAPAPSVIVNAAGTRAYLVQTMANGLGYNTSFDTTVFPKVSVLNLETREHQTSEHISLPETDQPVGLPWDAALAKNDQELWVVNAASNDVSVIDISDPPHPGRIANIPVGDNPRGIVLSPDGIFAFVNNTLAGTLSVVDTNTYTVTEVITTTNIPLPPVLLNGKRLFFSSARPDLAQAAWISCNTCHVEGEHDGRTWLLQFLGEVPPGEQPIIRRNTTSLLGMIETYPLRWSAEWDESADSEFSVRFEQFGSGLIDGEMHSTLGEPNQGRSYDLDCLAAFIDSLAAPSRTHTLTAAEQRGKVVFESSQTQCVECHPAPLYTDLQVHDVGTANGDGEWFGPLIDTPTLRFLYDSAPYLHDGSALTLQEVFTDHNPNDEHGVTSNLTAEELDDLIAYLMVLPHE
jgi:YVTN family beta-propeller protein